jgi:hypothetical protein
MCGILICLQFFYLARPCASLSNRSWSQFSEPVNFLHEERNYRQPELEKNVNMRKRLPLSAVRALWVVFYLQLEMLCGSGIQWTVDYGKQFGTRCVWTETSIL